MYLKIYIPQQTMVMSQIQTYNLTLTQSDERNIKIQLCPDYTPTLQSHTLQFHSTTDSIATRTMWLW